MSGSELKNLFLYIPALKGEACPSIVNLFIFSRIHFFVSSNHDAQLERAIRDIYYNFYERQDKPHMHIVVETNSPLCIYSVDDRSLYYRLSDGRLVREYEISEVEFSRIVNRIVNLAVQQGVEYVVYVVDHSCITPSFSCLYEHAYPTTIKQFFEEVPQPWFFYANILDAVKNTDPLTQIFLYRVLLSRSNTLKNAYICWDVITVVPSGQDQSSLFHGRTGIVAYCTPLVDFVLHQVNLEDFNKSVDQLKSKARKKLESNKELYTLWQKDPVKACDIDLIKTIIHDEIEEANELMKQYNIIRVAFPLD